MLMKLIRRLMRRLPKESAVFHQQRMLSMDSLMASVVEILPAVCLLFTVISLLTSVSAMPRLRPLRKAILEQSKSTQRYRRLLQDLVCRVRVDLSLRTMFLTKYSTGRGYIRGNRLLAIFRIPTSLFIYTIHPLCLKTVQIGSRTGTG